VAALIGLVPTERKLRKHGNMNRPPRERVGALHRWQIRQFALIGGLADMTISSAAGQIRAYAADYRLWRLCLYSGKPD
jgi:hypothetical protein